jgi:hypothetical protein
MKAAVLLNLLIFFSKLISQIELNNLSLYDSTKKILYVGTDNYIKIGTQSKGVKYALKTHSNQISISDIHNEENSFFVYPKQNGYDTLFVFQDKKCVSKEVFKIEKIEPLVCILGKNKSNQRTITDILQNPTLNLYIPNSYLKNKSRVISFELLKINEKDTIELYGKVSKPLRDTVVLINIETGKEENRIVESITNESKNYGNTLSEYQKSEVKKMKKGDFLVFERIVVSCPNSANRMLPTLIIKII